ncbi:MAG TPA: hypothetical protein VHE37_14680 [Nevskiaceae bacterium]|nr:hypothetical protein [Nevskiaceae bacterium]
MNIAVRDGLKFHAVFFLTFALVLWLEHGSALGSGLLALAISYNVLVPALGFWRGHAEWLSLWSFLAPLSMMQVLPDCALARIAHVLVFPDLAQYRIGGEVPVYFMGLWIMLLFPILLLANAMRSRYTLAALLTLVLFAFCEWAARPLGLWHNEHVAMTFGVAHYALLSELLLGLTALWMYRLTRHSNPLARAVGAICVSVFYTGSVFLALLLTG